MLKIKDDINLKELEKFGFVKDYYVDFSVYVYRFELGTAYKEEIIIWEDSREIQVVNAIKALTVLYKLIHANLVEKVSD